jgi:2-keto-4-pentenoate hydratase/2-oxohepta-3-ene-1,7-dioic acid hydratase in catechol pathway
MRRVTNTTGTGDRAGLLDGDTVRGLPEGETLLGLLGDDGTRLAEAGERARTSPAEVVALSGVTLRAPIPRPRSVRDSLSFLQHLRNCRLALGGSGELEPVWSKIPTFCFANAQGVVGPHEDVPIAPGSEMFDLELEVGAVIGRGGRDLHPDTAEAHIAGFTLYNDWTARDHQVLDMQQGIGMAKGKDSAITLGPALVTPDELERRDGTTAVRLSATVNGEEITSGTLDQMDWTWGELLAYASRGVDLVPGEVIGSGIVTGGCLLEHVEGGMKDWKGWLQPGDVVSLRGEGLGETVQTVRPGVPVHRLHTGY